MFRIQTASAFAIRPGPDLLKIVDRLDRPGPRFKTMMPLNVWCTQSDGNMLSVTKRRPIEMKAKRKGV